MLMRKDKQGQKLISITQTCFHFRKGSIIMELQVVTLDHPLIHVRLGSGRLDHAFYGDRRERKSSFQSCTRTIGYVT